MPLDRATLANRIKKLLTDAGHPATGEGDFGWQMVAPNDGRDHVLIACEPSDWWRSMPGGVLKLSLNRRRLIDALRREGYRLVGVDDAEWDEFTHAHGLRTPDLADDDTDGLTRDWGWQ